MIGPTFGLYSHIRNNRWRSVFLMAGLLVLVLAISYAIALVLTQPGARVLDRFYGVAPVVMAITAAWTGIGYGFNVAIIGKLTGSQEALGPDKARLMSLMEPMCISRGMQVPKLAVIETPALNAFASGVNEKQYTVTVTRGLLETLNDAELEGVLAHELTHIRNGDVRLMIVAVLIAGVISLAGELMLRGRWSSSSSNERGSGKAFLFAALIMMAAWFFAVVIRFALSRSREYLADAGAVELTKNPDAMISALLKIAGRADIEGVPSGVMDMCIENDPDGYGDMFATHPSLVKRVQALVDHAGGRLPQENPQAPKNPPLQSAGPRFLPPLTDRQSLPWIVQERGPWGPRQ
jgi:heat shock protein HtpX